MAENEKKAPGTPSRDWRGAHSSPPGELPPSDKNKRRRRTLYAVLAVVVVLTTLLLVLLRLLAPFQEPFFLSVAVTEYKAHHFPTNALADLDGAALFRHFPQTTRDQGFTRQEKHLLKKQLDDLRNRKKDQPLVFHLSALTLTDGGELYVLPNDALPDRRETWLPFKDVLQAVQSCPSRQKLLLLDLTRPVADPRLGVLADDVADHLAAALQRVEDPGLWVLSASSPGQIPLLAEDVRLSVFGYYLDLGLRRWADGYAGGRRNNRVSVKELTAFVKDRVDRWAWENRHMRQTPVLLREGADFDLVTLDRQDGEDDDPPAPEAAPYPIWLLQGWKLRDGWKADETLSVAPLTCRQLEAVLLRAEGRWRGGVDKAAVQRDLRSDLDKLKTQVRKARDLPSPDQPASLALWARLHGLEQPDPEIRKTLSALLGKWDAGGFKLPADVEKAAKEFDKFKVKNSYPEEVVWAIFQGAAADNKSPLKLDKIRFLQRLLTRLDPPPPLYVETLFLKRLTDLKQDVPAEVVQRALRVVGEGEKAANCDPRVLAWVRPFFPTAMDLRQEGESLLLAGGDDSATDKAEAALKEAERSYRTIHEHIRNLRDAQRADDRARAFLPAYARYLALLPPREADREEKNWDDAVQQTRELGALLAKVSATSPALDTSVSQIIDDASSVAARLNESLGMLQAPFQEKHLLKLKQKGDDPAVARQFDLLLEVPFWSAEDRETLWKNARDLSGRLHQETAKRDYSESQQHQTTPVPTGGEGDGEYRRAERQAAARRARLAIALLRMGGLKPGEIDELERGLRRAEQGAAEPESWHTLARALRQALAEKALGQFELLLEKKDLLAADRLGRILHPFDLEELQSRGRENGNPAAALRREEVVTQWSWLGERYQKLSGPGDQGRFYESAANIYLRISR